MNRKIGVQIIVFITAFLFIFTTLSNTVHSIPPVTQETLIVDITGNGDYTSIQEAIDNADATDIVLIRKGIYNEHSIGIGKKIEIIGEDPSNTIINCSGNIAITLSSAYVDISNIQIINTEEFAITTLPGSTGCTISNCIINTNYKGVAIDIRSSYNTISDCNLIGFDTSKQGVKIHGSYNVVENCDIQNFANGVLVIFESSNNQIIGCNIIDNENAIDFRLDSNNNIVTGCNIYSNLQSIKIWQGSNYNLVYLNNFWKNDINTIDEGNNSWDNGAQGNYWDKYQGQDSNGDGIGDTPYTLSRGNNDRFPVISRILPDIVTAPTSVRHTTSKSDHTPSFAWNPSIYNKGLRGYYVKIDTNSEIFIGDTTSWTSSEPLSDGVHMFYVWGVGEDNTTSSYSIITFSIDTSIIDTDADGWSDEDEQQYGTDPDNPDNYPLDSDGDHIPDSVDTDDDNDGYSDDMESSYGTDTANLNDYPTDTDNDGIPDDDSSDGKYTGDVDDDGDGLTDIAEATLGSSSKTGSDATKIYIGGNSYYLVDVSQDSYYDVLYEPTSGTITGVEKHGEDYLLDVDGDGTSDRIYSTSDGSVSAYEEQLTLPLAVWLFIVLIVILAALFIIPKYLKRRPIKYRAQRKPERIIKRPLTEKILSISAGDKKDTVEMITQTRALLQHIQQDVEVYMDKLHEMEQQFTVMHIDEKEAIVKPPKEDAVTTEEKIELPEEKTSELEETQGIESKVDKLLSQLDDKDKN